jgi:hypothetical protein
VSSATAWTYLDKAAWPDGPWRAEPDMVAFSDPRSGYALVVRRNDLGIWCGYVGLPPGSPHFEDKYQDVVMDVHGGLSFSGYGDEIGLAEDLWWFGFDCGHAGDYAPALAGAMAALRDDLAEVYGLVPIYRDLAFVLAQVLHLAPRLAGLDC